MEFLYTAFALGALGSFHCIGMCGPIALSLPIHKNTSGRKLAGSLLYNLGRVSTYALMGALFGLIGKSFVMAGFQQSFSIVLGIAIILGVVLPATFMQQLNPNHVISKGIAKVKLHMQKLFQQRSYTSIFLIGSLNGLLPCGLVYLGIAGATAMGNPAEGAAYMLLFGLGTWPVMLLVSYFGQWISLTVRNKIRSAIPYVVMAMGIVFILRGLSLDIPFVSPNISHEQHAGIEICH